MNPGDELSFRAVNEKRGAAVPPAPVPTSSSSVSFASETPPTVASPEPPAESPLAKLPFDPLRIVGAVLDGTRWIILAAVFGAGLGFGIGFLRFKTLYLASSSLIRQEQPNTFQTSEAGEAFKPKQLAVGTLVSVMRSTSLLKKVGAQSVPPVSPGLLGAKLTIVPERNTDVIRVEYEGWDSAAATASVLSTYAEAVVQLTRDLQAQEATQVNGVLKQQLATIDKDLAAAGETILAYSKESELVSADKETDAYLRQLGELSLKYETQRIEFETLDLNINALQTELARHNPAAAKLQQAREELNNLLVRYTEANPAVIDQRSRVEAIENEMVVAAKEPPNEAQMTNSPAGTSLYLEIVQLKAHKETLAKQLEQLAKVRDNMQAKLAALPEKAVQLARMRARQQSLETARTMLASRQREAQLFEQSAPGYYRVLNAATVQDVTTKGRWPKVILATFMLGALGAFGALGMIVTRELLDDRIKTAHDFARTTKLPVLLRIPAQGKGTNADAGAWAFRAWSSLAGRLQSPGGPLVLGVAAASPGTGRSALIHLLAGAAAQRGQAVIAITNRAPDWNETSASDPAIALSAALADPRALFLGQASRSGVRMVVADADWTWSREARQQWVAALAAWRAQRSLVVLLELPPGADPETLLLAETLSNLLWVGSDAEDPEVMREKLEAFQVVRGNFIGSVFRQTRGSVGPAWLSKWALALAATALLVPTLQAGEPVPAAPPERQTISAQSPAKMAAWQERLTLGPGDTVNLSLFGRPDYTRNEVPVGPDGRISYLDAVDVLAMGRTIDELRAALDAELSKSYRNARTIVTPAVLRSKQYFILGKVVDKGAFTLDRPLTIIEAVARARGLETGLFQQNTVELADLPRSFLVRHGQRMKVDFEKLFQQGDLSQNIQLEPDDYLYFPSSNTNEVYVLGAVTAPGVQGFTPNATVVSMVTTRGGFGPKAYLDRVLVVRGSLTSPQTFVVNVHKVLNAKAPDFPLEPKDIVYVSEKPWARAEELLDIAMRSFVQAMAAGWAGNNMGPYITAPLIPSFR